MIGQESLPGTERGKEEQHRQETVRQGLYRVLHGDKPGL